MGIGLGVLFVALGAILSFAVQDRWNVVDLTVVGYILMGVGALSIILGLVTNQQRARTTHREVVDRRDERTDRRID